MSHNTYRWFESVGKPIMGEGALPFGMGLLKQVVEGVCVKILVGDGWLCLLWQWRGGDGGGLGLLW